MLVRLRYKEKWHESIVKWRTNTFIVVGHIYSQDIKQQKIENIEAPIASHILNNSNSNYYNNNTILMT